MSFILDALKKSEAERQRQAGPTLLEVRVTRPRRRYPLWAAVLGALLGINAVVLAVVWLHKPSAASAEHAPPATADLPAPAPAVPASASPPAAPAALANRPAAAPASPLVGSGSSAGEQPVVTPVVSADTSNPADEAPAVAAGSVQVERAGPDTYAHLPSISQIGGNVPALQLDLLDYSDHPNERYALINMHRVREGDVLPEGPRVLAITRDGVALDYRGQDFLLRPGGAAQ
jgi:general secretion pathway protein B